jgi:hypothetical protein
MFSVFMTLGHLRYNISYKNVVVLSYDRACSWNCMPEYKLIQNKNKNRCNLFELFPWFISSTSGLGWQTSVDSGH